MEYLGHMVDSEGPHPTEEKVKDIVNAPCLTNITVVFIWYVLWPVFLKSVHAGKTFA